MACPGAEGRHDPAPPSRSPLPKAPVAAVPAACPQGTRDGERRAECGPRADAPLGAALAPTAGRAVEGAPGRLAPGRGQAVQRRAPRWPGGRGGTGTVLPARPWASRGRPSRRAVPRGRPGSTGGRGPRARARRSCASGVTGRWVARVPPVARAPRRKTPLGYALTGGTPPRGASGRAATPGTRPGQRPGCPAGRGREPPLARPPAHGPAPASVPGVGTHAPPAAVHCQCDDGRAGDRLAPRRALGEAPAAARPRGPPGAVSLVTPGGALRRRLTQQSPPRLYVEKKRSMSVAWWYEGNRSAMSRLCWRARPPR